MLEAVTPSVKAVSHFASLRASNSDAKGLQRRRLMKIWAWLAAQVVTPPFSRPQRNHFWPLQTGSKIGQLTYC
ncbi:hypothetical protein ACVWXO_009878 [Bradyrhizobium sp. LM2.7]